MTMSHRCTLTRGHMTRKDLLDRARKALPSLAHYYNDHGEDVEGDGDLLAAYVAKTLIENDAPDPDCGDGGLIAHLTMILDQAMADLTMVCAALEAEDATPEEGPRR